MWDEANALYHPLKPDINRGKLTFDFRWDSRISFNGLQHDASVRRYDGAQFALFSPDQLEEFSQNQFFYMGTRVRSKSGVRPYIRATCNPEPDSWLAEFLDWWIGEDGYIIPERCGIIRYFVRDGEDIIWSDDPITLAKKYPGKFSRSVTFILSTVYDNKELLRVDPEYIARLQMQHPLVYMRLHGEGVGKENRGGNWKMRAGAGILFNASWFGQADYIPPYGVATDVLYWDTAATEKDADTKNEQPSATAYIWLRQHRDDFIVMDCGEFYEFATIEDTIMNKTREIAENMHGQLHVRWEREPASAAKREANRWSKMMREFTLSARGIPSRTDKVKRALPAANAAHKGHILFRPAPWNQYLANYLHNMPKEPNDLMDALSGAYNSFNTLNDSTSPRHTSVETHKKRRGRPRKRRD